jgi:hypothetical protein
MIRTLMRRSTYLIALVVIPALLLFNSCKKSKVDKGNPKTITPVPVKIAIGCEALDIQFDYNGDLYILASDMIQVLSNGKLKTLALPARVFSEFIFDDYEDISLGRPQYIAVDRKGTIILARADGFRAVYKDGRIRSFVHREVGWTVDGVRDVAISTTNEVFYASPRQDPGILGMHTGTDEFAGIHLLGFDSYAYGIGPPSLITYSIDVCFNNIMWLGTNHGIIKSEFNEQEVVKVKLISAKTGTKAEGPADQVKLTNVTQLEASDDGSIICFIDEGILKQIKNNEVKIIMPMPDTRIALSKDAKKLYFIENGDLMVIDL